MAKGVCRPIDSGSSVCWATSLTTTEAPRPAILALVQLLLLPYAVYLLPDDAGALGGGAAGPSSSRLTRVPKCSAPWQNRERESPVRKGNERESLGFRSAVVVFATPSRLAQVEI